MPDPEDVLDDDLARLWDSPEPEVVMAGRRVGMSQAAAVAHLANSIRAAEDQRIIAELREELTGEATALARERVTAARMLEETETTDTELRSLFAFEEEDKEDEPDPDEAVRVFVPNRRQSLRGVIPYVIDNPGKSATEIAKALDLKPMSVSSLLYKECDAGRMLRIDGKGPRGGHVYYWISEDIREVIMNGCKPPGVLPPDPRRSAWEELMDED